MADNQQTYNPLRDSSIEPDDNSNKNEESEDDLGSEIANQLTGQSYSDDSDQSDSSSQSE